MNYLTKYSRTTSSIAGRAASTRSPLGAIRALGALAVFSTLTLQTANAFAAMDIENSFESGKLAMKCVGNCPKVTTTYTRSGRYAMASTISNTSSNKRRTEVTIPGEARRMQFNRDYWIGFSVYLPAGWKVPNNLEALAEIIRTPDRGERTGSLPLGIYTGRGDWKVTTRWDGGQKSWELNSVYEDVGRWTDIVIHYKPSYTSSGVLEVWKDGALVAERNGPNTWKDAKGPYLQLGLMKGRYSAPKKTVYHDELRIASGPEARYADVAPSDGPIPSSGNDPLPGGTSDPLVEPADDTSDDATVEPAPEEVTDSSTSAGTDSGGAVPDSTDNSGSVALDEDHNFESGKRTLNCSGNCPTVTTQVAREGKYALRAYIHRKNSSNSFRTESVVPASRGKMQFNRDYWIGFSVFLPQDWEVSDTFEMVAQIHSTLDPGDKAIGNPLSLNVGSGRWKVLSRGEGVKQQQWYMNSIWEDVGKWTDFVIHYKPSYTSSGVLEVWKNGILVAKKNGPNTYEDRVGPYFKMGVYLGWKDRNCCNDKKPEKIVYHDALRIASGSNASYADVAPRGSRN